MIRRNSSIRTRSIWHEKTIATPLLRTVPIVVLDHTARQEIVITLEEWLSRIPDFLIKDGTAPITYGGHVFGMENLILDWS